MSEPPDPYEHHYEHRACEVCGARTDDEAAKLCKQFSDPTGEYHCHGGAEGESYPDGRLRFMSDAGFAAQDAWVDEEIARLKESGEW
jgi:hypothetical protein